MRNSVGVWSTNYDVINGQALVTKHVVEQVLPGACQVRLFVFPGGASFQAIGAWIVAWVRLWVNVLLRRVPKLYLVCSRSNFGFLRDVPALLTSLVGIRVVVHAHGSDVFGLLTSRHVSPLARFLYARCDVVVPSRHLLEPLLPLVKNAILVENYVLTVQLGSPPRSPATGLNIFWNSNVMSIKGFFDLIAAVRELRAQGLDLAVTSIGSLVPDGEMSAAVLAERFAEVQDLDWFVYLGQVSQISSVELLRGADAVALPSVSEAQPVAIIEAMCLGRGVVVSDILALLATVGDYPCEIVRAKVVTELIEALRRLYLEKAADPVAFFERRSGPAMSAKERFSVDRFNREISHAVVGPL